MGYLDEIVAEGEEGVERADAEIGDVEPVERRVEGVARDGVLEARPERIGGGARSLHGKRHDPITCGHLRRSRKLAGGEEEGFGVEIDRSRSRRGKQNRRDERGTQTHTPCPRGKRPWVG
jgi:hypothetical protein